MKFDGKHPLSDMGVIKRNMRLVGWLKEDGKTEEAEELKAHTKKLIKKYNEVYGEGINFPGGNY